jgi:hypothetical protein
MPKYYLLKDWNMCSMMFGCTSVSFSHRPSLGAGGMGVPSCSQMDRNPLTAGYCRQGIQVYSKFLILEVIFYFQNIFFQDSVHFLPVRSAFATRCGAPLDLGSANVGLKQGLTKSGTFYKFLKIPTYFQTTTYFLEFLRKEAR